MSLRLRLLASLFLLRFSKNRLVLDSFQEEQVTQAIDFMLSIRRLTRKFGIEKKKAAPVNQQDNEVIVFTEQEPQTSEIRFPPQFNDKSVKVIVRNPPPLAIEPAPLIEPDGYAEEIEMEKTSSRFPILLSLVAIFSMLVGGALWGIKKIATDNLEKEMISPIFAAEQQELHRYILQLEAQKESSLISIEARELVLLFSEYLFWRDFKREEGQLEQIKKALSEIEASSLPWLFYSFQAMLAVEEENFELAKTELQKIKDSNLVTEWVNIEIAHSLGEEWTWKKEYKSYPRLETLAITDGLIESNFESSHGWVLIVSLRNSLGELDEQQTNKVMKKILRKESTIGSRHGANFLLLRSLLHDEPDSPKAKLLRYQAYEKAKYDPDIQFWYGYDLFLAGKMNQAKNVFGDCYQHRIACSSGYIFLLVS